MLAKQQIIIQYSHLLSPKGKILVPQNIYLFTHLLYPTICSKGFQRYNRNTITNNKLKISLQLILSSGYILLRIKSQSTKFKGDWINYFLCVVMLSILYTVRIISSCFYMILGFAFSILFILEYDWESNHMKMDRNVSSPISASTTGKHFHQILVYPS